VRPFIVHKLSSVQAADIVGNAASRCPNNLHPAFDKAEDEVEEEEVKGVSKAS